MDEKSDFEGDESPPLVAVDIGGEICFGDFGGARMALIFRGRGREEARSYSSMIFVKSSSDFTAIKVSKSPFGNGHFNSTE